MVLYFFYSFFRFFSRLKPVCLWKAISNILICNDHDKTHNTMSLFVHIYIYIYWIKPETCIDPKCINQLPTYLPKFFNSNDFPFLMLKIISQTRKKKDAVPMCVCVCVISHIINNNSTNTNVSHDPFIFQFSRLKKKLFIIIILFIFFNFFLLPERGGFSTMINFSITSHSFFSFFFYIQLFLSFSLTSSCHLSFNRQEFFAILQKKKENKIDF